MSDEDRTVVEDTQAVEDDAQLDGLEEETTEAEDLSLALEEAAAEEPTQTEPDQPKGTTEPGWIKKRVNSAVQKAVAETEARLKAQYDAQLAPIRQRMIEQEAQELVRSGEFKSKDRAIEYLQLKGGMPANNTQPVTQPAQSKDATVDVRAQMLAQQAQKIKANKGIDVMAAWQSDDDIRQKIASGEWDFYDVADSLSSKPKRTASPMRSPNGASGTEKSSIASMSKEQFRRLEKRLEEGARFKI